VRPLAIPFAFFPHALSMPEPDAFALARGYPLAGRRRKAQSSRPMLYAGLILVAVIIAAIVVTWGPEE